MDVDLNFAVLDIIVGVLAIAVAVLAYEVHSRGSSSHTTDAKPEPKCPVKAKTPEEKVQDYLKGLNQTETCPSSEKKQEETVSTSMSKPIESTPIALPSSLEEKEETKEKTVPALTEEESKNIMELLVNG